MIALPRGQNISAEARTRTSTEQLCSGCLNGHRFTEMRHVNPRERPVQHRNFDLQHRSRTFLWTSTMDPRGYWFKTIIAPLPLTRSDPYEFRMWSNTAHESVTRRWVPPETQRRTGGCAVAETPFPRANVQPFAHRVPKRHLSNSSTVPPCRRDLGTSCARMH
jgi:hypothetical protein